jgi:CheY-like chemotaxis protein
VNGKALVIEHDPEAIEQIEDVLVAMGHEHRLARNLVDARKLVQDGKFSYGLLDWDIPARSWGSRPRVQNSMNLLDEIRQAPGMNRLPVIVMVDRAPESVEILVDMMRLAVELAERGHVDFICKPFPTAGRTLDRVIQKNISNGAAVSPAKRIDTASKGEPPGPARQKDEGARPNDGKEESSPDEAIGDGVAHEAVTLDDFMARFCQERSKQNRICRKKALLAAARHRTVKLPELAAPHKHGKPKKYFVHDLLASWQGFLDEGVDLPPLLPQYQAASVPA